MFEIECPACGKKNTGLHTEGEAVCKRCQADLTMLIRIRDATMKLWAQAIICLGAEDVKQARTILSNIERLTPLSEDEPLVWLLKSVNTAPDKE